MKTVEERLTEWAVWYQSLPRLKSPSWLSSYWLVAAPEGTYTKPEGMFEAIERGARSYPSFDERRAVEVDRALSQLAQSRLILFRILFHHYVNEEPSTEIAEIVKRNDRVVRQMRKEAEMWVEGALGGGLEVAV